MPAWTTEAEVDSIRAKKTLPVGILDSFGETLPVERWPMRHKKTLVNGSLPFISGIYWPSWHTMRARAFSWLLALMSACFHSPQAPNFDQHLPWCTADSIPRSSIYVCKRLRFCLGSLMSQPWWRAPNEAQKDTHGCSITDLTKHYGNAFETRVDWHNPLTVQKSFLWLENKFWLACQPSIEAAQNSRKSWYHTIYS